MPIWQTKVNLVWSRVIAATTSTRRRRGVRLAGHDQFHDQTFLAVWAGVELTMDDPPAVVLDLADGP